MSPGNPKFKKGLQSAAASGQLDRLMGVYQGELRLKLDDIDVYPVQDFCEELCGGRLLS